MQLESINDAWSTSILIKLLLLRKCSRLNWGTARLLQFLHQRWAGALVTILVFFASSHYRTHSVSCL